MEFGAVLKELTYKSVCLFFIFSYSFFAVACVAQHEEDKAIAVSEMCIFKKVLYNIPIDSIDRQIYKASFFLIDTRENTRIVLQYTHQMVLLARKV